MMKTYDPKKTLISIHIPKCAGLSFRSILEKWFGEKIHKHYFDDNDDRPPKQELGPGLCIHGHFNKNRQMGVEDYYPGVDQFITVFREPLDAAKSLYFYWRKSNRARQIKTGFLKEGSEMDSPNIDEFFRTRPHSHILLHMPCEITMDNYKEIIESKFVWIGLVERLQEDVDRLANILGFDPLPLPKINISERNEELSQHYVDKFMEENQLEFEIYHYLKNNTR